MIVEALLLYRYHMHSEGVVAVFILQQSNYLRDSGPPPESARVCRNIRE